VDFVVHTAVERCDPETDSSGLLSGQEKSVVPIAVTNGVERESPRAGKAPGGIPAAASWMINDSYGLPVVTHGPVPLSLVPASAGDLPHDAAHPWQDRPVGRCVP
jgi:hypothetical protein